MIGPAASVASAAGLGWLAVGLGCLVVGLGCLLQIGLASGKAGWQLLPTISAGLIHENQPTVCKGNAFSWNKCQK